MRTALLIARGVAATTLAAVLLVFVALSVATQIAHRTGFPVFVIDGSSMVPSIARGALVFEQPVDPASIRAGDVVTVRQNKQAAYTHRVVEVVESADGPHIQTRGDANPTPDPALVPASAVVGRVLFWVPIAGYLLALLGLPMGMASVALMIGSLAVEVWVLGDLAGDWIEPEADPDAEPPRGVAAAGPAGMPHHASPSNSYGCHRRRRPVRRSAAIRRRQTIGAA